MSDAYQVLTWADAGQEPFVREAAAHQSLRIAAVGSSSSATASDLARDLDAERCDDLRQMIANADGDLIWLIGAKQIDRDLMRLIHDSSLPTFSCHPLPDSLTEAQSMLGRTLPHFVPRMRRSAGFRAAMQIFSDFGEVTSINVAFRCGRAHGGGLFGRLYDAMDVIDHLCGEALSIDAALAGAIEPPAESLGGLAGHTTINMRFADNRCACAALSDGAGTWFRGVTALGDAGCLRISDGGFEWLDPQGRLVDSHMEDRASAPGAIAAEQIVRILENRDPDEPPPSPEDHARLLALCEAARLSCRTGHGEAPRKVLEMLSRP